MSIQTNPNIFKSDLMEKLTKEKESALVFVERRYPDWTENYELYRNKVRTNRLTQRQSVNIPLMKETVKTILAKTDDGAMVDWKELGGDEEKEIMFQEIWNDDMDRINMVDLEIQDTKNVLLYGRSFMKLNWEDKGFTSRVLDIFDITVDPLCDPLDIETARYVIHQNIFRPLREILASDRYTKKGKDSLKTYLATESGLLISSENQEEWTKKQDRLVAMGMDDKDFKLFAGGDIIVSLTEHYTSVWNEKTKDFERRVICYANDSIELSNHLLEDLMGVDFWPFVTWTEDVETQDFWSDGLADLIRTPNKVLNIWFSQMVENRTLRNFQMHWYDATQEGYQPQTYEPGPGRMLPAPGDPNKTIMPVAVDGLDETLNAINFLTSIAERASGATAIEKGQSESGQQTLGEIKVLVGKAMERVGTLLKLRRRAKKEFATKYHAILDANASGKQILYKSDKDGNLWPKTIYASDWRSKEGYKPMVMSTSEQEEDSTKSNQKFQFLLQQFPTNQALKKIAQKRMLEIVDLTADEIKEVQQAEQQQPMPQAGMSAGPPTGMPAPQPLQPMMQ